MESYYVVLEDMNYDNNHIKFISVTEESAIKWALQNTNPKKQQIFLYRYDMTENTLVAETNIPIPFPK